MSSRALRVLVVEDEWIVALETQELLAAAGYEVTGPAATVQEAMGLLDAGAVDAALLDINLTREQSYPVAERLIAQGMPFVFVSGFAARDLPERFRVFPLLAKPTSPERMLEALRSATSHVAT